MNRSNRLCLGIAVAAALTLTGCSQQVPPALKPLPPEMLALLGKKGMREDAPIFMRIFKEESELEVWKAKDDGRFHHLKTYPICTFSGKLGPKLKQGDKQAPEGFYRVARRQMNPNSKYHLSFNLGYPNRYDRSHARTGKHLMVHGDCKSAGCYAMTDALVEEIYILAREALAGGQDKFDVHAYPFRMTQANMRRHRHNKWAGFWRDLKRGYDHFEMTRLPPSVAVCERRYLVNVSFVDKGSRVDPQAACPAYERLPIEALPPSRRILEAKSSGRKQAAAARTEAPQASVAHGSISRGTTFGFAPLKPSVAGFMFRNTEQLGN